ncbi:MAG: hypothetical protein V1758_06145 [Pseudomonadota bacterium]
MQCPACSRHLPAGKERCLYCGATVAGDIPTTEGDPKIFEGGTMLRQRSEKATVASRSSGKEDVYFKLNDLPEALRQRVEEALARGKGKTGVDEWTSSVPEPPSERERLFSTVPGLPPGAGSLPTEVYMDQQFSLMRSRRKASVSKLFLTVIFFFLHGHCWIRRVAVELIGALFCAPFRLSLSEVNHSLPGRVRDGKRERE